MPRAKKQRFNDRVQLPMFPPDSEWRVPSLSELPSDWNVAKRVAFDTETRDPQLRQLGIGVRRPGNYMVGFSIALEDGPKFYVPIRHNLGDNVEDPTQAVNYLRHQFKNFKGLLVGANISYDLDYAASEGAHLTQAEGVRDVLINDPLIYELHHKYGLEAVAVRHGFQGKDVALLEKAAEAYGVDPKGGLWQLPGRYVGGYAEQDAALPLAILRRQERVFEERNLWDIYKLESQLIPVLVKIRRNGVLIDIDRLNEIENWSLLEEQKALAFVKRETGYDVGVGNVWKAEAMAQPLRSIGVDVPLTAQGGASIKEDILDSVKHPVARQLLWARRVNKIRTTFAQSIRRYMVDGRIHCTFNQITGESEDGGTKGVRYGRLSAEHPNMQQQPGRAKSIDIEMGHKDLAKRWRSIYLPDEGDIWCSPDYSQQEPRWIVHYGDMMGLPGADEAARRYRENPDVDSHDMMTRLIHSDASVDAMIASNPSLFKKWRGDAKLIFLGLAYGEGGAKMCRELGLPTRWAVRYRLVEGSHVEYFEGRGEALERSREFENSFVWEAAGAEGQAILDQFDDKVPFLKGLQQRAMSRARRNGRVTTHGGRQLHFLANDDGSMIGLHKALNRVIQGTGADQMKKAMVDVDAAGHKILLQVHDELPCSVRTESEGRQIAEIMRETMPARVPFKVDVEFGPSWGESMS